MFVERGLLHWAVVFLLHSLADNWRGGKVLFWEDTEDSLPKGYTTRYVPDRLYSEEIRLLGRGVAGTVSVRQCAQVLGMEEKVKPDLFEELPEVCSSLVRV